MTVLQGSSKVHIISHSMGNRVTSEAFLQYRPAGSSNLGQLIFAAIDIKASLFSQRLAGLSALGAAHPPLSRHIYVACCHARIVG